MSNTPDTGSSPEGSATPPPEGGAKSPTEGQDKPGLAKRIASRVFPKTLGNASAAETRENVPDVKFVGSGDTWKVISKASSDAEGWMKSTKAMNVPNGVVIQVTTQQRSSNGYALAEALTFVPSVKVTDGENGGGRLIPL